MDIKDVLEKNYPMRTKRMCSYAAGLYCAFGEKVSFGRSMAEEVAGLKPSRDHGF